MPEGIDPSWHPMSADSRSIKFGIEPCEPDERRERVPSHKLEPEWYELDKTPAPTRVRAGLLYAARPPATPSSPPVTTSAAVVTSAPSRDVLGNSSFTSPGSVVTHADRLGAMKRDNETGVGITAVLAVELVVRVVGGPSTSSSTLTPSAASLPSSTSSQLPSAV
jgi:hypothetical protein